jgi:uncharacterized membrane protein YraQ (UPF0718 family)
VKIFDSNLWIVLGLLIALAGVALGRGGVPLLGEALGSGGRLFLRFGLVIFVSFLVAGLAETLIPRAWISSSLGEEAGFRGLLLATLAGAVTPAGPFISMPIAVGMLRSGAAPSAVVTFLAAWSLISVHRLFAWEIPILGAPFAVARWTLSLGVPLLLGFTSKWVLRS